MTEDKTTPEEPAEEPNEEIDETSELEDALDADPAEEPDPAAVARGEYIEALLHERAVLEQRKLPERVKQVDAQLKLSGYKKPTRNTADSAPRQTR